jgi:hypothetical protein
MKRVVALVALLALAAATRLPQLASPHLGLDGDEAVVALMARHFLEGRETPWFFWGQSYGFTFPEASFVAAFFAAFGESTATLKAAMLALWSAGVALVALAARRAAGRERAGATAAIAALLLVTCPAWMSWSMKARGGYLTSFVVASLAVWWIAGIVHEARAGRGWLAGIGAALGLIWLCQPLWLPGLAPFVFLLRRTARRGETAAIVAAAAAAVLVLVRLAGERSGYWSPGLFEDLDPRLAARGWPRLVAVHLGGMYYYDAALPAGAAVKAAAAVWIPLVGAAIVVPFARRGSPISRAASVATVLSLAFPLFASTGSQMFRYLLPVTGFAAISLAIECGALGRAGGRGRLVAAGAVGAAVLGGLAAAPEFGRVSFSTLPGSSPVPESVSTPALVAELDRRNIRYVYTFEPTLQWKVLFASGERILARWRDPADRYPAFPRAVDEALRAGRRTALVGRAAEVDLVEQLLQRRGLTDVEVFTVIGTHFVVVDPPAAFVRALGFELNEPAK